MASGLTQDQERIVYETEQMLHEARYNPYFAEMMRSRNYNEDSWAHGEAMLVAVKTAGRAFEQAQSTKLKATNAFRKQRDALWVHSSALSQSCVNLFQGETDYLNALGLHARRKDGNGISEISKPTKSSKIEQVLSWQRNLFDVAQNHTEIAAVLAANGFPAELLEKSAAGVEALARADHVQEQAKAESTQRREERDAAYMPLKTWLRCAQRVAKLAKKERAGGLVG
ncbi:MAG: hypothetical protein H6631_18980 [Anaerolineaceae bacterium]|nr:hypothetical protein [Anaerolineaceae bacterium]